MSALQYLFQGRLMPSLRIFCFLFSALITSPVAHSAPSKDELNPTPGAEKTVSNLVKLGYSGEKLNEDVQTWSCVSDQKTGLTWEKRDPTTALHGHDTFIWYQPEQAEPGTARAHPELAWADSTCFGFNPNDPASFCNTNAYTDRVNQSNYCGYSDWRLPTAEELLTLVDPTREKRNVSPLIDTRFFPFHKSFLYWTNTIDEQGVVATVFSDNRVFANSEKSDTIMVRLVRGNIYQDKQ